MADNKARAAAPKENQPFWLATDTASASKLNTVSGSVDALLAANVTPQQDNAQIIRPIHTTMVQIERVLSDCIVCKEILSEEQPDDAGRLIVAKPPLMRKSLWDDKIRNEITYEWNDNIVDGGERTAIKKMGTETEDDDEEEIQVITPSYQESDLLMVALGADPWLTTLIGTEGEDGIVVTAYDTNIDSRAWARKKSQVLGADA